MTIEYKINAPISAQDFICVLQRSTLAELRPVDDVECMDAMVSNSNLLISAWSGDRVIGVARCLTDFNYICFLSELAVDSDFQRDGIGKQLIEMVKGQIQASCKLVILAAPEANDYYPQLGFDQHPRAWVLDSDGPMAANDEVQMV